MYSNIFGISLNEFIKKERLGLTFKGELCKCALRVILSDFSVNCLVLHHRSNTYAICHYY